MIAVQLSVNSYLLKIFCCTFVFTSEIWLNPLLTNINSGKEKIQTNLENIYVLHDESKKNIEENKRFNLRN